MRDADAAGRFDAASGACCRKLPVLAHTENGLLIGSDKLANPFHSDLRVFTANTLDE